MSLHNFMTVFIRLTSAPGFFLAQIQREGSILITQELESG